ncbi:transcriptional regulator [Spirochaetia bacterium]|nr:transcriptional regulator [Spirochaetia bacterium]
MVVFFMATIREIAELAEVSRGTVDRVLNNRGYVKPDTKKKIQALLQELHYQPNRNARALSIQKKNFTIAYIYRATEINVFFDDVITGLKAKVAELSEHRISLLVKRIKPDDTPAFIRTMNKMQKAGIDGFIITAFNNEKIRKKTNELVDQGFPVIACNVDLAGTQRLAFVGCNLYRSGYIAGGLLSITVGGRANIGIVTSGTPELVDRIRGFTDAIHTNHPDIHIKEIVTTEEDNSKTLSGTKAMMKKNPGIRMIFSETVAVHGVCRALKDLGVDKKVKVICFDDMPSIRQLMLEGYVSAIVFQNPFWQGYRSFELLWDYLLNRRAPEHEFNYSITEIRIRESIIEDAKEVHPAKFTVPT